MGYSAIDLLFAIRYPLLIPSHANALTPSTITPTQSVKISVIDVTPVLSAHLFGETAVAERLPSSTPPVAPPPSPPLPLNVKVQGIYYSSNPHRSFAIILQPDKTSIKDNNYRVGDRLNDTVVVHQILPNAVVLLRNGQTEKFLLEEKKSSTAVRNIPAVLPTSSTRPEETLATYQRQLQSNPESLSQLVKVAPLYENNRFLGYRLMPGKDANAMAQFNLQSGDILTAVNGVTLDASLNDLNLLPKLATADQLNLQLLRNGQPLSLNFAIRK